MAHVGHLSMKTKPGAYARVAARYRRCAEEVMAHHANLHDVVIVGDAARSVIEGFGIWENAAQASKLEDTRDFAAFQADVEPDLAEPIQRSAPELICRLRPRP
jgi:quinol monooxygenase YgiN